MIYAVLDGGIIVGRRTVLDPATYPPHKFAARDEKGDNGPTLRPIIFEGEGVESESIIERDRVRVIRKEPPLPQKAALLASVDSRAEELRLRYITPGAGMALTYQEKFAQAQAVSAMGRDAANALSQSEREAQFPTLSASVGIEAPTLADAANLVLARYANFARLSLSIERIRLGGKASIQAATSDAEANAAYEAISWTLP